MRKLLIFWELPQFILALILLIIFKKRIFKTEKYIDSNIYFVKEFPGGISLSYLIFLNELDLNNLRAIKHEYGHTIQSTYLGWLYLVIVGLPSIIRAKIWNTYKLEDKKYYEGFPENWADRLGGV
jgi:ABC-type dipeptide/oligopeptide/nickel transport system permease component